jgi:hypothetical protein
MSGMGASPTIQHPSRSKGFPLVHRSIATSKFARSAEGVNEWEKAQAIGLLSLMRHGPIGHDSNVPTVLSERRECFEHCVIGFANVEIGSAVHGEQFLNRLTQAESLLCMGPHGPPISESVLVHLAEPVDIGLSESCRLDKTVGSHPIGVGPIKERVVEIEQCDPHHGAG